MADVDLVDPLGRVVTDESGQALTLGVSNVQVPSPAPFEADAYHAAELNLLPRGPVWPREPDSMLSRVMSALAPTYARQGARGLVVLQEAPAGELVELLPEWEATLGLPDPCAGDDPTIEARQRSVRAQIASRGGQSIAYYVQVAAALGYAIAIEEFAPLRFGDGFGGEFGGDDWAHTWRVTAPTLNQTFFEFGASYFGEGFSEWGSEVLECTLRRIAPAHTVLQFAYVGQVVGAQWDTQGSGWDKGGWA